ncbi:translocating chain-associating membrane protein [Aphelenchoides avenae]|nr:translocating chain-associating membrane protein [Aphelenchus avenae]
MGAEARRAISARNKKASPPILSHEFVIQNHGDIMSCILMLAVLGFMFQVTQPISQLIVLPQYNESVALPKDIEPQNYYRTGVRDVANILFYSIACITATCVLQEYFMDKIARRFHFSKTRLSKFNESGHLLAFSLYSAGHAGYILHELGLHKDFTQLWIGYPEIHRYMTLSIKLFYLLQIAYWVHQFPEFYFQKVRKEDIRQRTIYSLVYLTLIAVAYYANFNRLGLALLFLEYISQAAFHLSRLLYFTGKVQDSATAFKAWNFLFVTVRFATLVISVLTLWYGLRSHETPYIDVVSGNFNTHVIRLNSLLVVVAVQLYMLFNFSMFHFARFRERSKEQQAQEGAAKKKQHRPKKTRESSESEGKKQK